MSVGGVYGDDMEDLPDFEDPALSELLGGVRATYGARSPVPSPALAVYFEAAAKPHRSVSMRRVLAQLVAATTVVVAATGGLAVAGALPAPVQDAVSDTADNVGVEVPQGDDATAPPDAMDATTTPGDDDAAVDEPTTVADETGSTMRRRMTTRRMTKRRMTTRRMTKRRMTKETARRIPTTTALRCRPWLATRRCMVASTGARCRALRPAR